MPRTETLPQPKLGCALAEFYINVWAYLRMYAFLYISPFVMIGSYLEGHVWKPNDIRFVYASAAFGMLLEVGVGMMIFGHPNLLFSTLAVWGAIVAVVLPLLIADIKQMVIKPNQ